MLSASVSADFLARVRVGLRVKVGVRISISILYYKCCDWHLCLSLSLALPL